MISEELLLKQHYIFTIFISIICIILSFVGYKLKDKKIINRISFLLIGFALFQEILDYANRLMIDDLYFLSIDKDLPFHLCHFGFYFSLLAIYYKCSNSSVSKKKIQFLFEIGYVIGFSGALQGILTVDFTDINNTIGVITAHLQHSLIILNSLWLIFAYGMQFSLRGILNFFIFLNALILPLGIINYSLGSNYLFLCTAPSVENPLLVSSEWPYYIFIIDALSIVYMLVLYTPFIIYNKMIKRSSNES